MGRSVDRQDVVAIAEEREASLRRVFRKYDVNGDGLIDSTELALLLSDLLFSDKVVEGAARTRSSCGSRCGLTLCLFDGTVRYAEELAKADADDNQKLNFRTRSTARCACACRCACAHCCVALSMLGTSRILRVLQQALGRHPC